MVVNRAPDAPSKPIAAKELARVNAICPYFTMFPLSVPLRHLREAGGESIILDPFCGRGTTNYAARILGLRSVGIDSNPVAAVVAQAKLVDVTPEQIASTCERILRTERASALPLGRFWELAFHPDTLTDLVRLRAALNRSSATPARKALRALILGALHGPRNQGRPSYFSNQMPRTFASKPDYSVRFWEAQRLIPTYVDVVELIRRKANYYYKHLPAFRDHAIYNGDSRQLLLKRHSGLISHVVTSPPYYGMRTYVPDQWLRNWFVGGPPSVEYRQPKQLNHHSPGEFAAQLAMVWSKAASIAQPGARFSIRFGGIHDRDVSPKALLLESLRLSGRRLRVTTIRSAGGSSRGKRQAEQFSRTLKAPIDEIDLFARLED
jgi:hypothetical protein